jgi:transcriptional regulator with XRE-family HTH domain
MIRVKVKEIAQARGISQRQLFLRSGLDIRIIQRVMRDPFVNITLHTLDKLAETLDVDASELIESVRREDLPADQQPPEKP